MTNLAWKDSKYPKESYTREVNAVTLHIDRQVREKNVDYRIQAEVNGFKPRLQVDYSINRQVFEDEHNGDINDVEMDKHLVTLWYRQLIGDYFEILSKVSPEAIDEAMKA